MPKIAPFYFNVQNKIDYLVVSVLLFLLSRSLARFKNFICEVDSWTICRKCARLLYVWNSIMSAVGIAGKLIANRESIFSKCGNVLKEQPRCEKYFSSFCVFSMLQRNVHCIALHLCC